MSGVDPVLEWLDDQAKAQETAYFTPYSDFETAASVLQELRDAREAERVEIIGGDLTQAEINHIRAMAQLDHEELDPQVPHILIAVNTVLANRAQGRAM